MDITMIMMSRSSAYYKGMQYCIRQGIEENDQRTLSHDRFEDDIIEHSLSVNDE